MFKRDSVSSGTYLYFHTIRKNTREKWWIILAKIYPLIIKSLNYSICQGLYMFVHVSLSTTTKKKTLKKVIKKFLLECLSSYFLNQTFVWNSLSFHRSTASSPHLSTARRANLFFWISLRYPYLPTFLGENKLSLIFDSFYSRLNQFKPVHAFSVIPINSNKQ